MVDVFISYARRDRPRVEPVYQALRDLGLNLFFDVEGIDGGDDFPERIDRAVKTATVVLGCWTAHALTRPWVRKECLIAAERQVLVPAAFEPLGIMDIPTAFAGINFFNLTDFEGDPAHPEWQRLIRALERKLTRDDLALTIAPSGPRPPRPPPGRERAVPDPSAHPAAPEPVLDRAGRRTGGARRTARSNRPPPPPRPGKKRASLPLAIGAAVFAAVVAGALVVNEVVRFDDDVAAETPMFPPDTPAGAYASDLPPSAFEDIDIPPEPNDDITVFGSQTAGYPDWVQRGSGAVARPVPRFFGVGVGHGSQVAARNARTELSAILLMFGASVLQELANGASIPSETNMALQEVVQRAMRKAKVKASWRNPNDGSTFAKVSLDLDAFLSAIRAQPGLAPSEASLLAEACRAAFATALAP